jgi:hypothetical protein
MKEEFNAAKFGDLLSANSEYVETFKYSDLTDLPPVD